MSSMTFGQKIFQPKPPIQGSFPLDHEGECKRPMLEYMLCMQREKNDSSKCRSQAKEYLNCRMNNNLMDKRDLSSFGYNDEENQDQSEEKKST
ncbi:cytochrome c oxidase assembly COX19 [Brachionus plicatilis]|uniref:Cytochrome c oxidase assembly COX19 n=1 Tax=Brachionus plicatilis TaxID=10195 RepID=A0A3M7P9X1_BRAPC|nr:cytochrome c oxidase assembly COX19 [Brachionus plicatilis]